MNKFCSLFPSDIDQGPQQFFGIEGQLTASEAIHLKYSVCKHLRSKIRPCVLQRRTGKTERKTSETTTTTTTTTTTQPTYPATQSANQPTQPTTPQPLFPTFGSRLSPSALRGRVRSGDGPAWRKNAMEGTPTT